MVGPGQTITAAEIALMNRRLIEEHGGLGVGFMNPGSLDFALEEIQGSCFGVDRCPTAFDKAATLGWRIIRGHIFIDGNKRTGIMAAMALLLLNGVDVSASQDQWAAIALMIARGECSVEEFAHFLRQAAT
jgi:death on curing protein